MSGKHILAFEADPLYANMLNEALGNSGHQVDVVSEGVEGLEKASATPPDLIYLCVELPRISGFSICNKIKKNPDLKGIPLLITSAEATPETFEKHKRLKGHADEYMHKPFSGEEIAAVVEALLDSGVYEEEDVDDAEIVEADDLEELVMEDEGDAVVLDGDDGFEELDDLGNVESERAPLKPVDSDISALADAAFDGLEVKDDTTAVDSAPEAPAASPGKNDEEAAARNAELERLQFKNKELTQKVESLEKQLIVAKSAKKSTVSNSEFLDLREALNNKDRELLDLKDSLNGKEKELLDLREKINGLERQKADLEDNNIDVHKHLNELEHQLDTLNAEHEQLSEKSAAQARTIEEFEETKGELEAALETERSGRAAEVQQEKDKGAAALEEQKTRMQQEADERLASELADKQAEHDSAIEALNAALSAEKEQALASLKDEHEGEMDALKTAHSERENELNGQLNAAQEKISELEAAKSGLESELDDTRNKLAETTGELENTQQRLTVTNEHLETERAEHKETRKSLSDTEQKLSEQTERADELDKAVEELESEAEELTSLITRNEELAEKAQKAVAIAAQLLGDMSSLPAEDEDEDEAEEA